MLAEILYHWLSPAPNWVKAMGYVREQVAMEFRHRRQARAWEPHLAQCRDLIHRAAEGCADKSKCVVLGSGLLLDIPLRELARTFEAVDLVDMAHPGKVRRDVAHYSNVNLVTADISGAAMETYDLQAGANPPRPAPDPSLIEGAGLVISANILSQLPLALIHWLETRCNLTNEVALQTFARSVVDHHLALLQNHNGQVCLITEVLRLCHDAGQPLEKDDPLYGAAVLIEGEEWWWDIAPRGEISKDFELRLRVLAIPDLANAPQARYCRNTTLAAP